MYYYQFGDKAVLECSNRCGRYYINAMFFFCKIGRDWTDYKIWDLKTAHLKFKVTQVHIQINYITERIEVKHIFSQI